MNELASLGHALSESGRGRPVLLQIIAEPGLGKTALLVELGRLARARDAIVLRASGPGHETGAVFADLAEPFASFVAADDEDPDHGDPDRRLAADDDPRALAGLAKPSADGQGVSTRVVAERVRRALSRLGRERHVVLVLDDVQWSDEGTRDVLMSLTRHPPRGRVLIAVAFRPGPDLAALSDLVAGAIDGAVAGELVRLRPGTLTGDEIAQLLPKTGPSRRRALFRACGGNPFFLLSVDRSGAEPIAGEQGSDWLPHAVRRALLDEIDVLSPESRRVADVAAVLGGVIDAGLLASVAGCSPTVALDALDDLSERAICRPAAPGRWQFRHQLVGQAIYEALPASTRFAMHRAASTALEERQAPVTEQARHLVVASERGDLGSARTIAAAAAQVAGQAPAQAEAWYAAALDIAPATESEWACDIELARAGALAALGRTDDARLTLHELLARLSPGDGRRIAATTLAARVAYLVGDHEESASILQREIDAPVRWPDGDLAQLFVELSTARLMHGSFAVARAAAEQAQRLSPSSQVRTVASAAAAIALCGAASGDHFAALAQRDVASRLVDGLTDQELAESLEVGVWLGWSEMFLEHLPASTGHLERCLRIARKGAHQHLLTHLLIGWGSVRKIAGELAEATEAFDEAREHAERMGSRELTIMAEAMQCRAATWRGDLDLARRLGERAVAAAERSNWFASVAVALLAQARVAAGDIDGCVEQILRAGGGIDLPGFDPASRCDWWDVAVIAALGGDDPGLAPALAARSTVCADALPLHGPRGFALLSTSRVRRAEGAPGDALRAALDARTAFETVGNRIDAARALVEAGLAWADLGDRAEAIEALASAERDFAACRAVRLRAHARAELRRLGHRVAALADGVHTHPLAAGSEAPVSAADVLSRREREVAGLVAQGLTNRQIAGRLVLSEKTVESHLSHIFVKLGVTSRAAVAAHASTPR